MDVRIEPTWKSLLSDEFEKPYFQDLVRFVRSEYQTQTVYPPASKIFAAFNLCPVDSIKVVILGQDPYHEPRQAHGLCFSVPEGTPLPPSLQNIYRELSDEFQTPVPTSGDLTRWAEQGVFLLNTTLTVRAHAAASHQRHGWETFTDAVVSRLAEHAEHLVFMLWGSWAASKKGLVDASRHLVLTAPHPSPLSAYRGFFGCGHFARANDYLQRVGRTPIQW